MNKSTLRIIIFIIITSICLLCLFHFYNINNISVDNYNKLHSKNDSLLKENAILYNRYKLLESNNDSIKNRIVEQKERIIYIKQKQKNEVKVIDNFYGNQLLYFFSNINIKADSTSTRK